MGMINARGTISPEDYLHLYWFQKISTGKEISYQDFQPTESLINEYNTYLQKWNEAFLNDRVHYEKPVDWDVNRKKTDYFKKQLQAGHEFEVWVEQELRKVGIELGSFLDEAGQYSGENEFGLEIKNDRKLAQTGNIYIEYQERLRKDLPWTNSGILKEDNTKYWIIGSPEEYYFFKKTDLQKLYKMLKANPQDVCGCRFVKEIANGTSKGFVMNRKKAREICCASTIQEFKNGLLVHDGEIKDS